MRAPPGIHQVPGRRKQLAQLERRPVSSDAGRPASTWNVWGIPPARNSASEYLSLLAVAGIVPKCPRIGDNNSPPEFLRP